MTSVTSSTASPSPDEGPTGLRSVSTSETESSDTSTDDSDPDRMSLTFDELAEAHDALADLRQQDAMTEDQLRDIDDLIKRLPRGISPEGES